jgi:hypothetical protein
MGISRHTSFNVSARSIGVVAVRVCHTVMTVSLTPTSGLQRAPEVRESGTDASSGAPTEGKQYM